MLTTQKVFERYEDIRPRLPQTGYPQTTSDIGEYGWGGAASTVFMINPKEDMFIIFLTQLLPSSTYQVRRELRSLVYSSLMPE